MDNVLKYQYWASLILKERMGTLSDSEAKDLAEWIVADVKNKCLYERLKSKNYSGDVKVYWKIDVESGLNKYNARHGHSNKRMLYRWISVAAIVTVLLGSGMLLIYRQDTVHEQSTLITPGSLKAELVLGDGSIKQLDQIGRMQMNLGQAFVNNTGTQIEYITNGDSLQGGEKSVVEYNELRIPTGGEYQLVLSDGTKVWLNSQSRLRFPVNFAGQDRAVYLEGEAFFEVAHDAKHPFYVKTKEDINIQVLGTSFNIRAYGDEATVEAVLEKGKIKMWQQEKNVVLNPGSRAVYDRQSNYITTESVDTELFTAWRVGQYIFRDEPIEKILQKLSRWYGIDVFFANEEAKSILFSGSIRKYETIKNLLEAMEISGGIRFVIKGSTITVSLNR